MAMTNVRPKRGSYFDRLTAEGYWDPAGGLTLSFNIAPADDEAAE